METKLSKSTVDTNDCLICLSPALMRGGGVPVMSPGCCGKFFHQACIDQAIATGNSACPNCRFPFPFPKVQQQIRPPRPPFLPPQRNPLSPILPQDEELLDHITGIKAPSDNGETAGMPSLPQILVACNPERYFHENDGFFVNINLKAYANFGNTSSRIAMDLVCVLDNSGSMSGPKLESLKEAMRFVRSQLGPSDRLSVVTFNSRSTKIHGLMKMTDTNRTISGNGLDSVTAGGGTSIYSGLKMAADILDTRRTINSIAGVFLLTDGQDHCQQQEKKDLGAHMRRQGYSLFCFGFGNDHDSAQLQEIANAAEGPFTFVESDSMVVDAFGGALGGQQGIIGRNLVLSITSDIPLLQTFSGRYLSRPGDAGPDTSVEVSFANMYDGEQRDVLVKLRIPDCGSDNSSTAPIDQYPLLRASLRYESLSGEVCYGVTFDVSTGEGIVEVAAEKDGGTADKSSSSSSLSPVPSSAPTSTTSLCHVRRVSAPIGAPNLVVDVQKNRAIVTSALERALALADRRQLEEARKLLQDTMVINQASPSYLVGDSMCTALGEDLLAGLRQIESEEQYFTRGGRAEVSETSAHILQQRCVYSKSSKSGRAYQSAKSEDIQSAAKKTKSAAPDGV